MNYCSKAVNLLHMKYVGMLKNITISSCELLITTILPCFLLLFVVVLFVYELIKLMLC
jgi:hypothetical protein